MEKFFKKVDYHYNIRGWLKSINDVVGLQSGSDPQDLFAFKLNYNTVEDPEYGCTSLYNGNIAQAYWRTASDDTQRKYGFVYDDLNRLLFASYTKPLASIYNTGSYDETINYDKNGNITRLQRNGEYDDLIQNLTIDDLVYSYNPTSPNQLVKVDDQTDNPNGFKDGVNTGNDYSYDAYGNMTVDKNKGITLIKYNHLNLPTQITFGTSGNIQYIYNASGVKVRKIVTEGTSVQTTDYLSGFQYLNNTLEFFPHAEGYVKDVTGERSNGSPSTTGVFRYIYNYTDHLGNIRLSYTKDPATNVLTILEENNYYPFGLKHRNYNMTKKSYEKLESTGGIVITPTNETVYDYKYNGKEWQDELGLNFYDYGARNYDPAIGRWMNIDPLAENSRRWNPYNYAYNNPVYFIDPDGMQAIAGDDWVKDGDTYKYDERVTSKETAKEFYGSEDAYKGESLVVKSMQGNEILDEVKLNSDGSVTKDGETLSTNSNKTFNNKAGSVFKPKQTGGSFVSLGFDGALIGGFGVQIGLVNDSVGNTDFFINFNGNMGIGLFTGLSAGKINPSGDNQFVTDDFSGTSSSITGGGSTPVFDASWTAGGSIDNSLHATDKMNPANFGKTRNGYKVEQSGMGPGGSWGAGVMYSFGTTKTL